jgi:hypothetical protein
MQDDPILAEMRRLRQEDAAFLNNDPERIYKDILRRQQHSDRKLVRLQSRKRRLDGAIVANRGEDAAATPGDP